MTLLHQLKVSPVSAEFISGLHPDLKRQVRSALSKIVADPGVGKRLVRDLTGFLSYRVGSLRIVYRVAEGRIVELVALGPRKTIYELTLRLIARAPDPEP